jgi:hypothetical protein
MKRIILLAASTILSFSVLAQTAKPSSNFGKVILDNENVRVTSLESNPGKDLCGLGKHSHGAHLTVLLTDANITVTSPDGKVTTQRAVAGSTFWSEPETHTVVNSGTGAIRAQMIEYKKKK